MFASTAGAWASARPTNSQPPAAQATAPEALTAKPAASPPANAPIFPLHELRRGMRGEAWTVFHGTQPEPFAIEVIDIVADYRTGMDAILFRSDDPRLVHSGVVAGMSGSPIYIGGRLVGALAYGYAFNKDPIGGITPIASMLEVAKLPYRPEIFPKPKVRARGREGRAAWADRILGLGADPRPERISAREAVDPGARLQRVETPISLAGFGPKASRFLEQKLGMPTTQSPGAPLAGRGQGPRAIGAQRSPQKPAKKRWQPGDSVSVVLIDGDNSVGANGTVTWVGGQSGERLLAFGHPMNEYGPTQLPMGEAHVHVIIPSVRRSIKLSSPLNVAGTMIQDRQPAISLRTDVEAPMIPVTTDIISPDPLFPRRHYDNRVAEHQALTPNLVASLMLDAVEEASSDAAEVVVEVSHEIAYESTSGPRTVRISQEGFFPYGADRQFLARSRANTVVSALLDNEFEYAKIRSIRQRARVSYGAPIEELVRITVGEDEIRAGRQVTFHIVLRDWHGKERSFAAQLAIPEHLGGEKVVVEFSGGDWVRPYRPMPDSLDDLVDNLLAGYPTRSLVASIYMPQEGLSTRKGLLHDLPDSVLETLSASGSTRQAVRFKRAVRRVLPTPTIIEGEQRIHLEVLEREIDAR